MAKYRAEVDGNVFEIDAEDDEAARRTIEGMSRPYEIPQAPPGMFHDPATGRMVNTKAEAEANLKAGGFMQKASDVAGQFVTGFPFVGTYLDEAAGLKRALVQHPSLQRRDALPVGGDIAKERARAKLEAYKTENPNTSTALNIAGGVVGTVPLLVGAAAAAPAALMAALPATVLGRMALGAPAGTFFGAGEGAISGYGRGKDARSRGEEAGQGALVGGVTGGALGTLAPAVGAGIKAGANKIADWWRLSPVLREAGQSKASAEVLDSTLAADRAYGGSGAQNIRRSGDEAMLADVGPSSKSLLDSSLQVGGKPLATAQQVVGDRVTREAKNIADVLDANLGKPEGLRGAARDIATSTADARRSAYQEAYRQPIDYASNAGRQVDEVLGRVPDRIKQKAIETANETMQAEGRGSGAVLFEKLPDGTLRIKGALNVEQLDHIKRGLDAVGRAEIDSLGRANSTGVIAKGLARDLRDAVGVAVPEYKHALSVSSDKITRDNALTLGKDLLTNRVSREDVAIAAKNWGAADKAEAAKGLRSHIDDVMARTKMAVSSGDMTAREAVAALRELSSRANRDKLASALDTSTVVNILRAADKATKAFELQAVIAKGSLTAPRLIHAQKVKELTEGGILPNLSSGKFMTAAGEVIGSLAGKTSAGRHAATEAFNQRLVEALTTRRGADAKKVLDDIEKSGRVSRKNQALADMLGRGTAYGTAVPGYFSLKASEY